MTKSGIEMIENLVEQMALLNKRFEIVEQNTKEILNRANGFQNKTQIDPQAIALKPTTGPVPSMKKKSAMGSKVMGKIENKEGKRISGVRVRVFNKDNDMVKETKTNRAGEWLCFLPPGSYSAEYFLENMIQAKVSFIVTESQKLIRVKQPTKGE